MQKVDFAPITIPASYNYLGVFLTFSCTLGCDYCLTAWGATDRSRRELSAAEWLRALNRIRTRPDLPVTLQGGEPTAHPGFYEIVGGLDPAIPLDLLTNLQFDVDEFMRRIPPSRFKRTAHYASIRVSYHPGKMDAGDLIERTARLLAGGYSAGIWGVLDPVGRDQVLAAQMAARARGIDFRTKEFLGRYQGKLFGTYAEPAALAGLSGENVQCRPSELLVAPDGACYRCHRDLFANVGAYGTLTDGCFPLPADYFPCDRFGECHPCDIKIKTNRFQEAGHTSVRIIRADAAS